jgi:hypothetical protein
MGAAAKVVARIFYFFCDFLFKSFLRSLHVARAWALLGEGACTTPPFIEPCPYTWKDEIFHLSCTMEILIFSKKNS